MNRPGFLGQVPLIGPGTPYKGAPVSDEDVFRFCDIIKIFLHAPPMSQGRQNAIDAFNTALDRWPLESRASIVAYVEEICPWGDFFYNLVTPPSTPPTPPPHPPKTPTPWRPGPKDVPTVDPYGEARRIEREWKEKQKPETVEYRPTPSIAPPPPPPRIRTFRATPVPRSEPTTARESYEQALKEFDARRPAPPPYEMTSEETRAEALKRHHEWMRSAGIQEAPSTPTGQCPPGQFFDGRKCRGSVPTGGIPTGGLPGESSWLAPTSTLAPGMTPSTIMTGRIRIPVVNLRRV